MSAPPVPSSTGSQAPHQFAQRTSSGTSVPFNAARAGAAGSPLAREILPPSSIPAHIHSPGQRPVNSSPLISPVPTDSTQPHFLRNPSTSTPSMDTLSDLASMQQSARPTPPPAKNSSSSNGSHRPGMPAERLSFDINMVETPKQLMRSDYAGSSLPLQSQQTLAELVALVRENSASYDAHTQIIKILHQGLMDHTYPPDTPDARNNPADYDLLPELRQARETADKLFAVGESLWLDWLHAESMLAQSIDARVAVMELCKRAVEEEYGSVRLWQTYGDWLLHCYNWANEPAASAAQNEEKMLGRELFNVDQVMSVWEDAASSTGHDLALSHEVWNKFLRTRYPDFESKMDEDRAALVLDLFQSRLQAPHAQWESTFQAFSSFVSANFAPDHYEQIMAGTLRDSAAVKAIWSAREVLEANLLRAIESGDKYAEYNCSVEYIAWEKNEQVRISRLGKKDRQREPIQDAAASARMINALYQRIELRLPSVLSIWEEHADYLAERQSPGLLDLLRRATRHCPWSGMLWKRLLLASELAKESFQETEAIQQSATRTGMLDAAGTEELLKVHEAWCGYLVRRTRNQDASEEDDDVAEMGIRTSIETVQGLAAKLDGQAVVDPEFRLQRKYIEYLKGQGRFDNARQQFDDAVESYGGSYRFWLRYYEFEMEVAENLHIGKRKRDDEEDDADATKRPRNEDVPAHSVEEAAQPKRDREHASILVQHIPVSTPEARVRQFFSKCGQIMGLKAVKEEGERSFVIEFQEADQAQYALSRHEVDFEGATLSVTLNTGNTLYVTNYPPAADESYIRDLFTPYGEIISVRFPSLKANKHRRFCYVEFKTSSQAHAALELNGQTRDELELTVAISNPAIKKERENAHSSAGGRAIFIGQLPFKASEAEIEEVFSQYGEIEKTRMPRDPQVKSKNKGICFITYVDLTSAAAALAMNGQDFQGRKLKVNMAQDDKPNSVRGKSASASASVNGGRSVSPALNGNAAPSSAQQPKPKPTKGDLEEQRTRTIALAYLPDTINEAQIRARAERIGGVLKVMLRTEHAGCLIEFESAADAGIAALELDGHEFVEGKKTRVVTQEELKGMTAETKDAPAKKKKAPAGPGGMVPSSVVRRPAQPGARKGGHLGQRTGLGFGKANANDSGGGGTANGEGGPKKSNDDFRALLEGKK
ncbi:putative RNA-binding protein [Cyphellophora attinorum]|uniref:U4/U6 snRNA-associated-splicing factor PRP24 n=1 Tax=Cyphellophora attinorum TaxID=1664694 RepID=A0A0N1H894_9EURO|nr:putative RNA-binding protein [Phialophora attinorum]KPI43026.1 putative RNA-binding protein [Phialophora attinorum]